MQYYRTENRVRCTLHQQLGGYTARGVRIQNYILDATALRRIGGSCRASSTCRESEIRCSCASFLNGERGGSRAAAETEEHRLRCRGRGPGGGRAKFRDVELHLRQTVIRGRNIQNAASQIHADLAGRGDGCEHHSRLGIRGSGGIGHHKDARARVTHVHIPASICCYRGYVCKIGVDTDNAGIRIVRDIRFPGGNHVGARQAAGVFHKVDIAELVRRDRIGALRHLKNDQGCRTRRSGWRAVPVALADGGRFSDIGDRQSKDVIPTILATENESVIRQQGQSPRLHIVDRQGRNCGNQAISREAKGGGAALVWPSIG